MSLKGVETNEKILALISARPMSVMQLAEALEMSKAGIANRLVELHAQPRRAHISGFLAKKGNQGRETPVWSAGNLHDVEYVPQSCRSKRVTRDQKREKILQLLKHTPRSVAQLAELIFVVRGTAGGYITRLRKEKVRRIYIIRWDPPIKSTGAGRGGDWAPVYAFGSLEDAPKPSRESSSARHARLMRNESYREQRNKERVDRYHQVEKYRKKPNTIFGALGL